MKRVLFFSIFLFATAMAQAQLEEDFTPNPTGWVLSQGASFSTINGNDVVLTPGVGGNNPGVIGTPAVTKTSNTVKVCLDIWPYTSSLSSQTTFSCDTYMDVLFVKSSVTSANDAVKTENIYGRVDNYLLPTNGGNTCFTFTFPSSVDASDFKVFLSFHAGCTQSGVKYVIDNISISGVSQICGGNNCPPTALDDVFNRVNLNELTFNAVLYGSNLNYPPVPSGYAVDATGTDNDPNDDYSHLHWSLVSGPSNGTVTVNADGTCTITRNSITVSQLTFTYQVCDDGPDDDFSTTGDNLCDQATVTVNYPVAAVTPVSFVNYSATRNDAFVILKWTTTFEQNNQGFEVMRNINNKGWESIGFVATKAIDGNSGTSLQYSYSDRNTNSGISLYRIVQVDKDGTRKYYDIKAVQDQQMNGKLQLFPNPSNTGNLTVAFGNANERDIIISDLGGRPVKKWSSFRQDNLQIGGLGTGMYLLQVVDKATGARSLEKFVITK